MHDRDNHLWKRTKLGAFFRIKHGYAFKGEFFADTGPYVLLTPGNFKEDVG
jgi:type I restriction enzyme, S subunit